LNKYSALNFNGTLGNIVVLFSVIIKYFEKDKKVNIFMGQSQPKILVMA